MNKYLKKILKVISIAILIPILSILALIYFVDPNDYKVLLSRKLQEKTGYVLQIQGPIEWQIHSLNLAVKAPDIALSSAMNPNSPIVKAKELNLGVQLLPLVLGKLVLNADFLEPTLVQSTQGQPSQIAETSSYKTKPANPKTFSNFKLKAEWIYKEMGENLILKNILLKIDDPELPFALKGDFQMNLKSPYNAEGNLNIANKELLTMVQKFASSFNPKLNLREDTQIKFKFLNSQLDITQLSIPFENKGNLSGQFKLNLSKARQNIYALQGNIQGERIQINNIPLSTLKSNLALSAEGKTADAIKKSLSGQTKIQLNEGKIKGVDLVHLLKHAQATSYVLATSINQKKLINIPGALKDEVEYWISRRSQANTETPFDEVSLTLNISNGIIRNEDLLVTHKDYQITGKGNVNLPNYTIDYAALALAKTSDIKAEDKIATFLKTTEIPIIIKADFRNPSIRPDFSGYGNYLIRSTAEEKVEKLIGDTVQKLIKFKQ